MRNLFLTIFAVDKDTQNKVNDKVWEKFKQLKKKELILTSKIIFGITLGILCLFHWPAKYMAGTLLPGTIEYSTPIFANTSINAEVKRQVIENKGDVYNAIGWISQFPFYGQGWRHTDIQAWLGDNAISWEKFTVSDVHGAKIRVPKHLVFIDITPEDSPLARYWLNIFALVLYYAITFLIWVGLAILIENNIEKAIKKSLK